nr:hypothetical protein CFP56_02881 [Quercus suber]
MRNFGSVDKHRTRLTDQSSCCSNVLSYVKYHNMQPLFSAIFMHMKLHRSVQRLEEDFECDCGIVRLAGTKLTALLEELSDSSALDLMALGNPTLAYLIQAWLWKNRNLALTGRKSGFESQSAIRVSVPLYSSKKKEYTLASDHS